MAAVVHQGGGDTAGVEEAERAVLQIKGERFPRVEWRAIRVDAQVTSRHRCCRRLRQEIAAVHADADQQVDFVATAPAARQTGFRRRRSRCRVSRASRDEPSG